ncbi:MAG: hypothetical protein ACR2OE_19150 [Thermomicrobiales bacterium]
MIKGRDFLIVVAQLREEDAEVCKRTLISRAYYAAFLEARSFTESHIGHVATRSASEHQGIPALLRQLNPELDTGLKFLRRIRNSADYDIHLSSRTMELNAVDAEDYATKIIARLDELAAERESPPESPEIDD